MYKKRPDFYTSESGLLTLQTLKDMDSDSNYNTNSSYSTNIALYADNLIPFVDKHMTYLLNHPAVNPQHYLSNLRLTTRIR